ncbi:MAG: exo-alpha-sialidase [Armatimonadetes bacterium]|nr:exo-alpha-sialidase [Armatimonadota bacterium]MDE2206519.1 exo-alpha-sialidase [Armatimonadota bacterium]
MPPESKVQNVTGSSGFFSEPGVAIDPGNRKHAVVVWQDPATAAWTDDGGNTWRRASGVKSTRYKVSGDVSVTFDAEHHAIICYMAFDKLGTTDYWAHRAGRNGIFVRRSLDGGATWESQDRAVTENPDKPGAPMEDKPWIVADQTKTAFRGNLYVGWTHFTLAHSSILLSRSTDDGLTWSAPLQISTRLGSPRDDNGDVEGFTGSVAPDGTLYVSWTDGEHIVFTRSHDGGVTFERSREVLPTGDAYFSLTQVRRCNGFPVMTLAPGEGGSPMRLYEVWSDLTNGDADIFCSSSDDRGSRWSAPVRVNDDALHDGVDQFFASASADPQTGALYVLLYDRRAIPGGQRARVVLARSTDGGRIFRNFDWTTTGFNPMNAFIGDYTAVAALGGMVYGAWAETQPPSDAGVTGSPQRRYLGTVVRAASADFGTRH